MQNPFSQRSGGLTGPATDLIPVTPDDTTDLTTYALALYVETGGMLSIDTVAGQTRSVEVTGFSLLPVGTRRVRATGTTALGIHAMVLA